MAGREDLEGWVIDALKLIGGSGSVTQVCEQIWKKHAKEPEASGDFFYTWQYDVRRAANRLRRKKTMRSVEDSPAGIWELAPSAKAVSS